MKGSNAVFLNQATMIDAVQHYFDKVLFKEGASPVVSSVARDSNQPHGDHFLVKVTDTPPKQ